MTDQYDYQTMSQKVEERAWVLVDQLLDNPDAKKNISEQLNEIISELGSMDSSSERDANYASIANLLSGDINVDSLIVLLSKISKDSLSASAAGKSAYKRYKAGDIKGNGVLLQYGVSRIMNIDDQTVQVSVLIEYAEKIQAYGQNYQPYANNALEIAKERVSEQWGIERFIEIAEIHQKAGQLDKSRMLLDMLPQHITNIENSFERDNLLHKLAEGYIQTRTYDHVLNIARRFSPEGSSLSLRLLAQETLKQDEYQASGRLISLIKEPKMRFLALESWMSKATNANDLEKMNQAAIEVKRLSPTLNPGRDRFEGYMLLTRYYLKIKDKDNAKEYVELTSNEVDSIGSDLKEMYEERVQSLNGVIGMW